MKRLLRGALALTLLTVPAAAEPLMEIPPGITPTVRGGITPISDINANNASGRNALEDAFVQVTIRGVAESAVGELDPFDLASPSTWFYVSDGTGTVAVANRTNTAVAVARGDSVEVSTYVFTQNGSPLAGTRSLDISLIGIGSITVLSGGATVPAPVVVSANEIVTNGATYEGSLVTVAGLTVVDALEWPAPGSSAFVRVTDGVDEFRLRIDEDTDLDDITPPGGTFDATGFVAQQSAAPYPDGHYLYPRGTSDLEQGDGSGLATVDPSVVLEGATDVSLDFTVTGQTADLAEVRISIPDTWSWTTPGTLSLSGAGFAAATPSFSPVGGGWEITVSGAAVTSANPGTLSVSTLQAPALVGSTTFTTATAVSGGTLTPIGVSPRVSVVSSAAPGDVVVNEVYPRTTVLAQGVDRPEFIELFNTTSANIALDGWTLTDIGRTADCTPGSRWAFPAGSMLPAGGYVVVCHTAFDAPNGEGFKVAFPSFPGGVGLWEMHDASVETPASDDPATPNLILLDPTSGNDQILLLGGPSTNVGQCVDPLNPDGPRVPFAEQVVLRNSLGDIIDVIEYREPGPCDGDFCDDGLTGPDDAYAFGVPKAFHTLGRNASSSDTDDSSADLRPSSTPTPGVVNVPGDTVPPELALASSEVLVGARLLQVTFDEPIDPAGALDPANYSLTVVGGDAVAVNEVHADPSNALRRFFLYTDGLPAGDAVELALTGLTDIAFDGMTGNAVDTTLTLNVPTTHRTICEVQSFDELGFSPLVGEIVEVAGFVTILPSSEDRFGIWVQEPGDDGCGVNVFSFDLDFPDLLTYGVQLNDLVRVRGRITEFVSSTSGSGAVTELVSVDSATFYSFLARGLEGPTPREVTTNGANDERLEGTLVRTRGTVVNANDLAAYIDDGTGATQVFQNFSSLDLTRYTVGDVLEVTGIITQFDSSEPFFSGYELVPQNQDAIIELDGDFAPSDVPTLNVDHAVLVPSMGERIGIEVSVPRRSDVIVEIFDVVGRKITTLYDGVGLSGLRFEWDGRGQDGAVVEPGAYVCHVRTVPLDGGNVETHSAPIVVGLRLE